jgi:hypothetical protein
MKDKKILQKFDDPGHGWVRIEKKYIEKLGIANKITAFSYQRGKYAYLEEDCDLGLLHKALIEKGIVPVYKTSTTNKSSKIRSYEDYKYNG